jgi:hypothetical protein
LDGEGLEPALPDVSTGMVMPLVAPDMGCQEPVHPAAQVPVAGRPEGQVEMIGHQTIGQHPHGIPEGRLGNDLNERVVIAILVKDLGTGITPVQDVVAETSGGSTGGAWHGEIPDESRERDHGRQIIHAMQTIKKITSVPFAFLRTDNASLSPEGPSSATASPP